MAALAGDLDGHRVGGGQERPGAQGHLTHRQPRHVVQAIDRLDRELLEEPVFDHHPGAALALLGRLEDEGDAAGEVAGLGQIARRAQQHRRVPVVAAGVHLAVVDRAVVELVQLLHGQRVHIGAQADQALAGLATLEQTDDAGAGQAPVHLDPPVGELLGDHIGGAVLLEGDLGMAVDVPAPGLHVLGELGDAVDDRHGLNS